MDQGKVQAIRDWPQPQSVKKLQRFLSFAHFYRRLILNVSLLSAPRHFHAPSETQVSVLELYRNYTNLQEAFCTAPSSHIQIPKTHLHQFHSGTGVEQCCLNTTESLPDSTLALTSPGSFPQRSGTTILEIGSCSPLNWGWRNGGTGWRELNTPLRSSLTTKTWNISHVPRV